MIPWKMKTASSGSEKDIKSLRDLVSQRSALTDFAFDGFFALFGIGGSITSVRMS